MIVTIVSRTLTQKGPCGMTVNNDIDDDSATKHSDSHKGSRWIGFFLAENRELKLEYFRSPGGTRKG